MVSVNRGKKSQKTRKLRNLRDLIKEAKEERKNEDKTKEEQEDEIIWDTTDSDYSDASDGEFSFEECELDEGLNSSEFSDIEGNFSLNDDNFDDGDDIDMPRAIYDIDMETENKGETVNKGSVPHPNQIILRESACHHQLDDQFKGALGLKEASSGYKKEASQFELYSVNNLFDHCLHLIRRIRRKKKLREAMDNGVDVLGCHKEKNYAAIFDKKKWIMKTKGKLIKIKKKQWRRQSQALRSSNPSFKNHLLDEHLTSVAHQTDLYKFSTKACNIKKLEPVDSDVDSDPGAGNNPGGDKPGDKKVAAGSLNKKFYIQGEGVLNDSIFKSRKDMRLMYDFLKPKRFPVFIRTFGRGVQPPCRYSKMGVYDVKATEIMPEYYAKRISNGFAKELSTQLSTTK